MKYKQKTKTKTKTKKQMGKNHIFYCHLNIYNQYE